MKPKEKVRFAAANVFADLGFDNPEEEPARADLAAKVDARPSGLDGTQKEIGRKLGLGQSEVSDLMRGRYGRFSIERLLRILTRLGCRVDVKVTAPRRRRPIDDQGRVSRGFRHHARTAPAVAIGSGYRWFHRSAEGPP